MLPPRLLAHQGWEIAYDGKPLALRQTGNWDYPWRAEMSMGKGSASVTIARVNR